MPFDESSFDFVIFGFCLHLCDREDIFSIASVAGRVLCSLGWLMILDFFSLAPYSKDYHRFPSVMNNKMDYSLLSWYLKYQILRLTIFSHGQLSRGNEAYKDDKDEWVAASALRKAKR